MKLNLYRGLVSWWRPALAARTKGVSEICRLTAASKLKVEGALLETPIWTHVSVLCTPFLRKGSPTPQCRSNQTLGVVAYP